MLTRQLNNPKLTKLMDTRSALDLVGKKIAIAIEENNTNDIPFQTVGVTILSVTVCDRSVHLQTTLFKIQGDYVEKLCDSVSFLRDSETRVVLDITLREPDKSDILYSGCLHGRIVKTW